MSEMKRTQIEGVEYSYDTNEEYEKDGTLGGVMRESNQK